jgi:hypothetical protein
MNNLTTKKETKLSVRSEALTTTNMKVAVFWDVA